MEPPTIRELSRQQVGEHGEARLWKVELNCDLGPCSMWSASSESGIKQQLKSFQNGRLSHYKTTLRSITIYKWKDAKGVEETCFAYKDYICDLKTYIQRLRKPIISQGRIRKALLDLLREIFIAFEDLHFVRNTYHGDIHHHNIVVVKKGDGVAVKLAGLHSMHVHPKRKKIQNDSFALKSLLGTLVRNEIDQPGDVFDNLMKHLSTKQGCQNLGNCIFFSGASTKMKYFAVAHGLVCDKNLQANLDGYLPAAQGFNWTARVPHDSDLRIVFDHLGATPYGTTASHFLRFCRNVSMHYPGNHPRDMVDPVPPQDQWNELYPIWPEFFQTIHLFLCQNKIFLFENII